MTAAKPAPLKRRIRKPYDPSVPVRFETTGPSLAKQSMAAACDINNIMARYEKTGIVEHVARFGGRYEDVSEIGDYQSSLNTVMLANELFGDLPAVIRARFNNDPAAYLEFVSNPANEAELREMGILPPTRPDVDPDASQADPEPSEALNAAPDGGDAQLPT